MNYSTNRQIKEYQKKHRRRSVWKKILAALGCVVVFCTTYALILPAITQEHTAYCGTEEHTHSIEKGCYEKTLVCGYDDAGETESGHVHTDECYEYSLTCEQTEHTHTTACFSNPEADVETAADWEKDFEKIELTGYYAEDLLAIAETQIGYKESTDNYIVMDDGETTKGYTRYGAWYGMPYEDWCAMFVSFCMNYAKVSTDDIPIDAGCQSWIEALSSEEYDLYVPAEDGYIPAPGDLIFFDDTNGAESGDGVSDHVGIVSKLIYDEETQKAIDEASKDTENPEALTAVLASAIPEKIETIEGNSDNQVQKVTYASGSADIMGYGCLPLGSWKSLTSEGEDYTITVNYSAVAELPEGVRLETAEILPGTEEYETYASRAAQAMNEEEGEVTRRFFDITLMSGDSEVEPAVPVKVDVSFPDRPTAAEEETVVHFPENSEEVEVLTATVDEDGLHYEQNGFSVVGFTANSIDTSKTYALVSNGYALTVVNGTLTAVETSTPPAADLVQWQFIYSTQSGRYSVKTTVGSTDYYLVINGNNNNRSLGLTTTSNSATTFTATLDATVSPTTVKLSRAYNSGGGPGGGTSTTFYVTMNGTSVSLGTNSVNATVFSLYYDPDAGKVATISPSSTVINLFDYRANINAANWKEDGYSAGTGINASAYALKFGNNSSASLGDANRWTGSGAGVLQGIVESDLGSDGYPALSKTAFFNDSTNINDSLDYLFNLQNLYVDEAKTQQIKQAYPDVKGLLQLGSDGYYYYDSTKNYAEFPIDTNTRASTNNNRFIVYDEARIQQDGGADKGQFFPFDAYADVTPTTVSGGNGLNHFFGLSLTTYFVQNYNGYADEGYTTPTTFEFSGDDDVWIFVDGVLVADLGGIHDAASVTINFAVGTVTINTIYNPDSSMYTATYDEDNKFIGYSTTFEKIFAGSDVKLQNYGNGATLVNNSSHTLNFFYLERGGNASNLMLKYNLLEIPATSIYKIDQYGKTLSGAEFAVYGATKQDDGTYLYNTDQTTTVTVDGEEKSVPVTVSLANHSYWDGTGTAPTTSYWQYRGGDGTGGDKWDILVTTITANEDGTTTTTKTTIPCKYHGVTDGNGEMIFQSEQGSILSLSDMAKRFGSQYFILREVDVPDGYRTVSDESWFHIDPKAGVMLCDSTYTSGVWASNNAQITATDTLDIAIEYNSVAKNLTGVTKKDTIYTYDSVEYPSYQVEYVTRDETTGAVSSNGTLFAVVLKRNGRDFAQGFGYDYWFPVYGTDEKGYKVVEDGVDAEPAKNADGKFVDGSGNAYNFGNIPGKNVTAAIAAAKEQVLVSGGDDAVIFTPVASGSTTTYKLLMENLPGKIDRYFTYMLADLGSVEAVIDADTNSGGTDPQYTIAYYWTSGTLEAADETNTVRVYSHDTITTGNFSTNWGTTIEVPNMENRLFFQKTSGETVTTTDAEGNTSSLELLDGAVFALYEAYEAPNASQTANIVYYVGDDGDGHTVYVGLYTPGVAGYEPNKAIVFSDPADTGGKSTSLGTGKYEIDKNFTVNITKDETTGLSSATIVPSEGSEPGLITVTIENSDGTKTQYYVHPAKNAASTPEALVGVTHDVCSTVKEEGTGHFTKLKSGKYYLREIKAPEGYAENTTDIPVLVDDNGVYANAGDADNKVAVGNGLGYLSKTLDVFASQNEIDESLTWVYGALIQNNASGFTAFQNVDGDVLKVGEGTNSWKFVTQDPTATSGYGTGTSAKREDAMVVYMEYSGVLSKTETSPLFDYLPNTDQNARTKTEPYFKTGDTIPAAFVETKEGETGVLRLWTQEGWSDLAVYQDYAYGHSKNADTTYYQDLTASGNISNLFSSSTFVQVTDEKLVNTASVDVTLNKENAADGTALAGAAFRLYKLDAGGNKQYYAYNAESGTTWVQENGLYTTLTSLADGTLSADGTNSDTFHVITNAEAGSTVYYLEETAAPDGFQKLAAPIEIHVDVTAAADGTMAVTLGSVGNWNGTTTSEETLADASTHRAYLYTLTVPNAESQIINYAQVNLDLTKVAENGATPLSSAQFQLYREKTETVEGETVTTREYYKHTPAGTDTEGNETPASTSWVAQAEADTLTSDANGMVHSFFDLEDVHTTEDDKGPTTYYLVETVAPAGYNLLTEPIQIDVDITDGATTNPVVSVKISVGETVLFDSNGTDNTGSTGYSVAPAEVVVTAQAENQQLYTYGYTLTVPNSTGYELPITGGSGTILYTLAGLLLILSGITYLMYRYKMRGKEVLS